LLDKQYRDTALTRAYPSFQEVRMVKTSVPSVAAILVASAAFAALLACPFATSAQTDHFATPPPLSTDGDAGHSIANAGPVHAAGGYEAHTSTTTGATPCS